MNMPCLNLIRINIRKINLTKFIKIIVNMQFVVKNHILLVNVYFKHIVDNVSNEIDVNNKISNNKKR